MKNLVILGAGGFAKEVLYTSYSTINSQKSNALWYKEVEGYYFANDDKATHKTHIHGTKILGSIEEIQYEVHPSTTYIVCGVGSPALKKRFIERASKLFIAPPMIHDSVIIQDASIGNGTVICAGNILTVDIKVGKHVVLNLNTTVGHDTVIEDYVNVSPNVTISGKCILKEGCDIGSAAVILPGITIGEWSIVGAGAVVTKDVPAYSLVVGIPAKVVKEFKPDVQLRT